MRSSGVFLLVLIGMSCRRDPPPAYPPGYGAPGYGAPGYGYPGYGAPGYAAPTVAGPPPAVPVSTPPSAVGKASYYADSLAGNHTANGERYDPKLLTAAHKKLPFGTIVDVTRTDTRATVRVRINDRGPFAAGRIIDLSRRAAESIDMIRAGVVDVELRIVATP